MYRSRQEMAEKGPAMLAKFDPNKKPLPKPRWATYAPFRTPQWKVHSNVGHVKNAVKQHLWIIRYDYDEPRLLPPNKNKSTGRISAGGWVEVERREGQ